ncbi:acetyl-CoA carboxylase carboxyltransferase subunit alpha [Lacticigenium naphthae]|uniref:acetyl-CoA carboxylase carboxyltransferase subunit alpha n=1 Tax=Lacticigenium naphthae TaxID=515351 RepID=UPI000423CCB2|nr:acetyl-CoA carboxylase carboxyltransferase subunit alpha [Lacticigenium naphthae]
MTQAMEHVKLAREIDRLSTVEIIQELCSGFVELHGDRNYKDDKAIVGGIGKIAEMSVTIIGNQKGKNIEENIFRNFGSPHPEGYRKSLRLMKQAEKFNRPVLLLVNTAGAYCGVEAEERGQGEAIARNLLEMSQLSVPILSIIVGEGGSGGALALAVANEVWMFEHAMYSILSPEGFASILWKDSTRAGEAAEVMKLTADDLLAENIIEKVIPEKKENEWIPREEFLADLKQQITLKLKDLKSLTTNELVDKRTARFRKF